MQPIIDVTFAELQTLISGDNLVRGQEYKITNFINHYTQLESGILTTTFAIPVTVEPLVVTAKSPNTLNTIAKSTLFEDDKIYYDINTNGVPTGGMGSIIRREDTKNQIVGDFDWRNEYFRVYQINVPLYNVANSYSRYDIVKVVNGTRFDFYINVSDPTLASNALFDEGTDVLTNLKKWSPISINSLDPFVSGRSASQNRTEVGQDFSLFNLTADLSAFVNRKSINTPSFNFSAGPNFNVTVERGIVIRDRVRNSTIKKGSGNDANVIVLYSADNALCKVNKNSYVMNIKNARQNITNAIVDIQGGHYTPYKSDDQAEDYGYSDFSTGFAVSLGVLGNNADISNSIITGGFKFKSAHETTISRLTMVSTGGGFSGNNVITFNGTVQNFKCVGVMLIGCIFGDLQQVYFQKSINTDIVEADKQLTFNHFNFTTRLFRVLVKPDAIVTTPNSSFYYTAMNMSEAYITDSIIELKKHPNNNYGGKGEFNIVAVYRDPSTKVLTLYKPVVDAGGSVTYEAY